MRRSLLAVAVALLVALPAFAGGAGGSQYSTLLPNSYLPVPAGNLHIITSQGYGGGEEGLIGGFGVGLFGKIDGNVRGLEAPVTALYGGFGGMLRGFLLDFRLLQLMGDFRVGFGGLDWVTQPVDSPRPVHNAGFAVLGALDLEAGLLLFPWFKLGVVGSLVGTATVGTGTGFVTTLFPEYGVRFSFGSFKD